MPVNPLENRADHQQPGAAAHQQQDQAMVVDRRQFGDFTVTSPMVLPKAISHLANIPDSILSATILQTNSISDINDFSWESFTETFGPLNPRVRSLINQSAKSLAKLSCKRSNVELQINAKAADLLNDRFPTSLTVKTNGLSAKHQAVMEPIQMEAKRSMFAAQLQIDVAYYAKLNEEFASIYPHLLDQIRIANSTRLILPHQIDEVFSFADGVAPSIMETTARSFIASHHHLHPVYLAFITEHNRNLSHFALRTAKQAEVAKAKEEKKKAFEEARAEKLKATTSALFSSAEADSLEKKIDVLANKLVTSAPKNANGGRRRKQKKKSTPASTAATTSNNNTRPATTPSAKTKKGKGKQRARK
ncbi:hypothetical protein HDV05_007745 [Chytridiales sp. JEL 0842]|nr:hypothetical protein HDV05_007745 [Chytridiales sp. JEL 0842]